MLTRTLIALIALALTSVSLAQDVLVRGGTVFDAVDGAVRPNGGILVRSGRIASMDAGATAPAGVAAIDLAAADCILPGIVDLHAHYNIRVCDLGRVDETTHYSIVYLANGVTTTFPAGEYDPEPMLEMRRRIDRGEQIGPRVLNSGPYFGQGMRRNATAEEVYAQVDEWAALGARGFKAKRINPAQLEALIERAHMHGLTVTAHLDSGFRNSVNPRDAILMGIDRIEHFLGGDLLPDSRPAYSSLEHLTAEDLDSAAFAEIVALFIERGVAFDATLTAYGYFNAGDDDVYEQWDDESAYMTPYVQAWASEQTARPIEQFGRIFRIKHETVRRFHEAGGTITLGTDHVSTGEYLQGFSVHREMYALNKAGIPAADVLRIATINGAIAMGMGDSVGTLEAGKLGDMLVIRGNPLEDITRTRTVHTVIKGGAVYDTKTLLDSVRGKLGPSGPEGEVAAAPAPAAPVVTFSGLRLHRDAGWIAEEPSSSMRTAQYRLEADAGPAALIVYYFGPESAGSIEANIGRWCSQLAQPDGRDSREVAIMKELTINGMKVHTLDVGGTLVAETRPGSGERVNQPNSHLLAAIVETEAGPYYFKLLGPAKTVEAWRASYERMLDALEPAPVGTSDDARARPGTGG